ncbi:MAG TPA: tetratricopeptide repeat protein [Vicinamibacterales bacterium]|jgi:tetratricopeptide (TPR) repeat protein
MNAPRLIVSLVLVALAIPSTAAAQRDSFLAAFVQFYQTMRGAYGDEGPQLVAQLERMTTALAAWDRGIRDAESELRPRLKDADVQTALEVHTILASLYLERGRFDEAVREFEADITIDRTRAAFHRYKGIIYQATARPADAADAFRATWLLEPADPQNIYRLLVYRSDSTTAPQIEQALASFAQIEAELTRLERRAPSPFRTTQAIDDDAGGGMGFVPPAYARGFSLLQRGEYEQGLSALRAAVAADPLVADAASRAEPMAQGIAALRQGMVDTAIDRLEIAAARTGDSSEVHRVLGTAYGIRGDIAKSVQHFRDAVRLNPRDERSWLALAGTLEDTGELVEAVTALRAAIAVLPDSGALRSRLASVRRQVTDELDVGLFSIADRLVMFAGKGELLGQVAAMAQAHLEYDRAVKLLELRVALTPNNAAAHKALGRAYVDQSREEIGYAELVMALLLDPRDAETLTSLGRLHLAAGRALPAVAALERALALDARNSQALNALGNALIRTGRTAEGRQRLEESVRWQAQDLEDQRSRRTAAMLSLQAAIHASKGEYEAAIDTWKQAITIRRDSVGPFQVADALIKAGRLEEASAVLQAAIPSNPRPEVHRRLAEVYALLGRTEESARERRAYTAQRLEELRRGG